MLAQSRIIVPVQGVSDEEEQFYSQNSLSARSMTSVATSLEVESESDEEFFFDDLIWKKRIKIKRYKTAPPGRTEGREPNRDISRGTTSSSCSQTSSSSSAASSVLQGSLMNGTIAENGAVDVPSEAVSGRFIERLDEQNGPRDIPSDEQQQNNIPPPSTALNDASLSTSSPLTTSKSTSSSISSTHSNLKSNRQPIRRSESDGPWPIRLGKPRRPKERQAFRRQLEGRIQEIEHYETASEGRGTSGGSWYSEEDTTASSEIALTETVPEEPIVVFEGRPSTPSITVNVSNEDLRDKNEPATAAPKTEEVAQGSQDASHYTTVTSPQTTTSLSPARPTSPSSFDSMPWPPMVSSATRTASTGSTGSIGPSISTGSRTVTPTGLLTPTVPGTVSATAAQLQQQNLQNSLSAYSVGIRERAKTSDEHLSPVSVSQNEMLNVAKTRTIDRTPGATSTTSSPASASASVLAAFRSHSSTSLGVSVEAGRRRSGSPVHLVRSQSATAGLTNNLTAKPFIVTQNVPRGQGQQQSKGRGPVPRPSLSTSIPGEPARRTSLYSHRPSFSLSRRRNTMGVTPNTPVDDNPASAHEIEMLREAIAAQREMKRKRREFLDDDKVLMGTKVSEGHQNYVTAYNMLTGIRVSVSRCTAKIDRELRDEDFTARNKLAFDVSGNELTPYAKYDFKFKDYAPWVFRHLRDLFKLDPADYLMSLTSKYIVSELGSPGKSGSFFYYSRDFRFIIKTIHHSEHKMLRRILKDYYNHVKDNPNTLISQFYGLHRVKLPFGRKIHFIVMNNLFPPHRDIHRTFDLKGSTLGRHYQPSKKKKSSSSSSSSSPKKQIVYKDQDFIEQDDRIRLGPLKREQFLHQLRIDVELLERLNLMDYSLLIGVHDLTKGNRENIRDTTLHVFQPGTTGNPAAAVAAATNLTKVKVAELRKALVSASPMALNELNLVLNEYQRQDFVFYADSGGYRATDEDNHALNEIYYLGVIDCLTPYTFTKRVETFWKSLNHTRLSISAIPSVEYGERFYAFIKSVVGPKRKVKEKEKEKENGPNAEKTETEKEKPKNSIDQSQSQKTQPEETNPPRQITKHLAPVSETVN